MPTMKTAQKSVAVLALALTAALPALAQQPQPGDPGYVRVQGTDPTLGAPPPILAPSRDLIDYREEMRTFIQRISTYARAQNRDFQIVVRDAEELIIKRNLQDDAIISPARTFTRSIDGVLYDGVFMGHMAVDQPPPPEVQQAELASIDRAKNAGLPVFIIDYATKPADIDRIYRSANHQDLIAAVVPRPTSNLSEIPRYPRRPNNENPNNVLTISDVKNFIYISDPAAFGRQDQFALKLHDNNFDLVIVDPFSGREPLNKQAVETLKYKKLGARRLVFARMDIASAASYRFYWQPGWAEGYPGFIGAPFPRDPDRYFVEYWQPGWQDVIFGNPNSFLYGLIAQGYDGVILEGMRNFLAFEGNVEIEQEFAPLSLTPIN
ncbi:MAG: hypothetical protein JJ900_06780 [Rhodospirillales bacterium]|nr:hypothetical protein [Rhodospirillales bacterium]MBO6786541.1 hypothetical protein [Rhodospirillales bacterium]